MRTAMGFTEIRDLLQGIDKIAHRFLHYRSVESSYFFYEYLKQPWYQWAQNLSLLRLEIGTMAGIMAMF
jgi:hypothetical protein